MGKKRKELSADEKEELTATLKTRFEENMHRHQGMKWESVLKRVEANPGKLWSLNEMERTGGEPDVGGHDKKSGEVLFYDFSPESPKGRRSLCYDRKALDARKKHKPRSSVSDMTEEMGVELLTEAQYRKLQEFDQLDRKTSTWVRTPDDIREKGGAIFCDRRYGKVFTYHNGADSYYASRGFRSLLRV